MCSYCLRVMGLDGYFGEVVELVLVFSVYWQKITGKRFDVMPQRELFEVTIAEGTLNNIHRQPLTALKTYLIAAGFDHS